MKELLSIAEYASLRGCSASAVYKRLKSSKNKLHEFTIEKDGQIYIKSEIFNHESKKATVEESSSTVEESSSTTPIEAEYIEFLKKQIEEKDKQIERLNVLLDQQQKLSLNLQLQLSEKATSADEVNEAEPEAVNQVAQIKEEPQEKKKSFWERLFG